MPEVTVLAPLHEVDSELDERIMSLRAAGMTTGQISRQLMIPVHEVHKRLDAILPAIDASYRRRAIAESLITMETIIATHMKTVADPESASIVIRATCERRSLLGITASTDPVQLSQLSCTEETSTSGIKRGLTLIEKLRRVAEERPGAVGALSDRDSDNTSI
jgi:hypothetical protein